MTNEFNDPMCIKITFVSHVRSKLEFSSVVWCLNADCWVKRIEKV